ncbi:cupin-like domain-containing protein [Kribbella sp. NPDC051770]|uniref:cupin-like domain-containing protein n=1 Tax=Kribbella sp. NPDC051770 TaxID=3155413 RepID=UPI00343C29F0
MGSQPGQGDVIRLNRPSQQQFLRAVRTGHPLIIEGCAEELSRGNTYSLDFLQRAAGSRRIEVDRRPSRNAPQNPRSRPDLQRVPFQEFRDRLATEAFDGPRTYLQDDVNNMPGLRDFYREPGYLRDVTVTRTKLWVSGRGLVTPLHYDPVEVVHWMMEGSKRWVLVRPGLRNLYPYGLRTKAAMFSRVDPDAPDRAAYPRWRKVRPIVFDLQAGELLYIPAFYWHRVESTTDHNVSMNYIWLASPWKMARYLREFAHAVPFVRWQAKRISAARATGQADRPVRS